MNAPLVVFVYNRLNETRQLFDSLSKNELCSKTDLFIFSDAPYHPDQQHDVHQVRKYIHNINGFNQIQIEYADHNKGLAESIIQGVSKIIGKYGKVIVLEDDLIVGSDFLNYMNEALTLYENRPDIWSIAGYSPPINIPVNYPHDIFLFRRASSHGWATWKNRWEIVGWDVTDFIQFKNSPKSRKAFNQTGNDMFRLLELQHLGRISSWAIRFCYSQFRVGSYTVYPCKSKVQINGYGSKATHSGLADKRHLVEIYAGVIRLEKDVVFDEEISSIFKKHQDLRFVGKVGFFLRKYGLGYQWLKDLIKDIRHFFLLK